uniref:Fe2OG dioxygenase domain-containing protein n=1 Tax=Arcella intermedia TaxID=1963864 RepID=A0A6B2L5S8_9EUKA
MDDAYRRALVLTPDKFATDLEVNGTSILGTIKRFLAPHGDVQVQLYRLNIYEEGGFFKSHVDTPLNHFMFGSLVINLPTAHKGGELIVRQHQKDQVFAFSSDENALQWAAFYSDCEHEIQPVTEGTRITLTYTLSTSTSSLSTNLIHTSPLYTNLKALLLDPTFLPTGGLLGYTCRQDYVGSSIITAEDVSRVLKGVDAQLIAVCDSLGLLYRVVAIFKLSNSYSHYNGSPYRYDFLNSDPFGFLEAGLPEIEDYSQFTYMVATKLKEVATNYNCVGEDTTEEKWLAEEFGAVPLPNPLVQWVYEKEAKPFLAGVAPHYGNQPSTMGFYCSMAVLVHADEAEARKASLGL